MARRVLLPLVLALGLAAPALAGDGLGQQKASLDAKLAAVQAKIASERARESRLNTQIGGLTTQIHSLEARVGDVSSKLTALQADLALHQRRLTKLNELYRLQTIRFGNLRHEYTISVQRLDQRLVVIYKQASPSTIDVLLAARSFQDVLDEFDYLGAIAAQDKKIAAQVATAKLAVAQARARTAAVRKGLQQETRVIDARAQQQAILRGELLTSRNGLASARAAKSHALVVTKAQEQAAIQESQAIEAASAAIAAKIQAADGGGDSNGTVASASAAGFIWPVSGPITSPFGMRWGTLHPGIDIGVPTGTPIHAAAAGTVIYCAWEEGYGNLVVIDHHNGLATAYAHQSHVASSCGENVAQNQVIGYSGCTGFCTGPHLHFEVRVNGTPVDPLGYLP
ncbi:MAG TPA: peptidoglycan DD-metalloendopeptidase family protein [Gaiellaceae bacterium]|nr:peptidoglycan DD-metalloendopeptidase family protein [Gaiellaceae bacterium]